MSTVTETTTVNEAASQEQQTQEFGQQLRDQTAAVSISLTKFGVSKAFTDAQHEQTARQFHANSEAVKGRKQLVDTKNTKFRAVTTAMNDARRTWKDMTVPYPERGIRLIRRDRIEEFETRMSDVRSRLTAAMADLEEAYTTEILPAAASRLGDLYNASDYPQTLVGRFAIEWEYPSVEAPDYLRRLNPVLWQQERDRIARRFDDAVSLAEHAFVDEFAKVVGALVTQLSPSTDGKKKILLESHMDNVTSFFDRFTQLSIGSNGQLETLVAQAKDAVKGIETKQLRKPGEIRDGVRDQMSGLMDQLNDLIVDQGDRRISFDDEE